MSNEPITREEILLNAVATGEQENIKPITREEMYLAKLGGADVSVPTPITRKEQFLQKAIENASNTGGGGSAVDAPTAFTVASTDELPANAPDGSMAVVGGNDRLVGEWEFNRALDFDDLNLLDYKRLEVYVTGNNAASSTFGMLEIRNNDGDIVLSLRNAGGATDLYFDGYWDDTSIITFFTPIHSISAYKGDDYLYVSNALPVDDFVAWVNANATKITKTNAIYTRENGEWVYKVECD